MNRIEEIQRDIQEKSHHALKPKDIDYLIQQNQRYIQALNWIENELEMTTHYEFKEASMVYLRIRKKIERALKGE